MWEWMANEGGTTALVAALVKGGWSGELVLVGDYTNGDLYSKVSAFRKARLFTKRGLSLKGVYIVNHNKKEYIHVDDIYFKHFMPRGVRKSIDGYTMEKDKLVPIVTDEEMLPKNEKHLLGGCIIVLIVSSDHSGGGDVKAGEMEGRWQKGNIQAVLTAPPSGYKNITDRTVECFLDAINRIG